MQRLAPQKAIEKKRRERREREREREDTDRKRERERDGPVREAYEKRSHERREDRSTILFDGPPFLSLSDVYDAFVTTSSYAISELRLTGGR